MKFIVTTEEAWLKQWDEFVYNSPKGSHLVYSDWLKSYQSYGFNFEVGLILDSNNHILAGYGAVIPRALMFKFYIIPFGPILADVSHAVLSTLFNQIEIRPRVLKCCAVQISIPYSNHPKIKDYTYSPNVFYKYLMNFKEGKCFDYVYAAYGLNWIDLSGFNSSEHYLNSLTPKVRRNVRIPYNKNINRYEGTTVNELKLAYHVIEENAHEAGYEIRNYDSIQKTLFNLTSNKTAKMLILNDGDLIKSSGLFILTNKGYTNIMGGVKRTKPDLKLGYMLQYEIIKESFKSAKKGYDISMGGSKGVQEFKAKFGAEAIVFDKPHYHLVINSFCFKTFKLFNSYIKPLKSKISKLLKLFK